MLSSRPTPHHQAYHAPHKENLYPSSLLSSKTPARGGLSIHKDAGGAGARTVGKPGAVKTPFGGGGPSKGTMTTGGRKGLGAGPSGKGRSDNEGNIGSLAHVPLRVDAPPPPPLGHGLSSHLCVFPCPSIADHCSRFTI